MPLQKIVSSSGGQNRFNRGDLIAENQITSALNLAINQDRLLLSKGYNIQTVPIEQAETSDVEELIKLVYVFKQADDTKIPMLFTTHAVYTYDGASWTIADRDTTAVCTFSNATNIVQKVAHGLSNGDLIKFGTDDTLPAELSTSPVYYVVNKNADDFQVALSSGGAAVTFTDDGTGNHSFTPCYDGSSTKPVKADTFTTQDAVIFTNCVDVLQVYIDDGGGYACRAVTGMDSGGPVDATAVTACEDLKVWNTRLFIFNTTEDGTKKQTMVRWSDVGDFEEWGNTAPADAGYEQLSDKPESIVQALILGDSLVIYREHSVVVGRYVGSVSDTVDLKEAISNEGAISPYAAADIGNRHVLVGWNNIYMISGGYSLDPIGDPIKRAVYGTSGDLDLDKHNDIFTKFIKSLNEVWIAIPVGTTQGGSGYTAWKTLLLRYRPDLNSWMTREIGSASDDKLIRCFAEVETESDPTWTDFGELTWLELGDALWSGQIGSSIFPSIFIGAHSKVLEWDHVVATDNGTSISYNLISRDFVLDDQFTPFRTDYIDIENVGGATTIEYSTDGGENWTTWGTTTSRVSIAIERIYKQLVAKRIRFRLSGTGNGFEFHSFGLYLMAEGNV